MFGLVLERGYEAVSIKDIVERADVGRSTFYAHFSSKDDLLTTGITELRKVLVIRQRVALAEHGDPRERCLGFSRALFEHADGYRDIYRALIGERGSAIMMSRMRGLFAELVTDDLKAVASADSKDSVPRSAIVQFAVGALMSILTWWMDRKTRIPPAEVDMIFRRLTVPGILAALDGAAPNRETGFTLR